MADERIPNEFRWDKFHKYFYTLPNRLGMPVTLDFAQCAAAIRAARDAGTLGSTDDPKTGLEYIKLDAYPPLEER